MLDAVLGVELQEHDSKIQKGTRRSMARSVSPLHRRCVAVIAAKSGAAARIDDGQLRWLPAHAELPAAQPCSKESAMPWNRQVP
jgi:hypothetical protein